MIIFIPAIVFIIAFMILGGIQPGGFITILGWICFIAGVVLLGMHFMDGDNGDDGYWLWALLCIIGGIIFWVIGGWFGDHTLFEFLFGTGWF